MAAGVITYQYGSLAELREANSLLSGKLDRQAVTDTVSLDPNHLTMPVYPMHPKRLGGIYYRGNDERSPELFNGGFYRTATLEVWLSDAAGNHLQWNDEIADRNLFITFAINRAARNSRGPVQRISDQHDLPDAFPEIHDGCRSR